MNNKKKKQQKNKENKGHQISLNWISSVYNICDEVCNI